MCVYQVSMKSVADIYMLIIYMYIWTLYTCIFNIYIYIYIRLKYVHVAF